MALPQSGDCADAIYMPSSCAPVTVNEQLLDKVLRQPLRSRESSGTWRQWRCVGWCLLVHVTMAKSGTSSQSPPLRLGAKSTATSPPPHSHMTIVSGYGSHRHVHASSVKVTTTTVTTVVHDPLHTRRETNEKHESISVQAIAAPPTEPSFPLYIQASSDGSSTVANALVMHSASHNVTLQLAHNHAAAPAQKTALTVSYAHDRHGPNLTSGWIPVQGLWGVYRIPSGWLTVWMVSSDPVYTATYTRNDESSTEQQQQQQHDGWWHIRRVREWHVVRIVDTATELSRAQRHEEQRQVSLLRQSLKDHDWYYCASPNNTNVIPDMTWNLQASLSRSTAALVPPTAHDTRTPSPDATRNKTSRWTRRWWVDAPPDARFFWNFHPVEPLMQLAHASDTDAVCVLLDHVIPVTSAFCGVAAHVAVAETDDAKRQQLRYDQVLLSRRSRFRAGTRFAKRGADATGAVANYAETEQILLVWQRHTNRHAWQLDAVTSHVQTRGSIPLRWSSPTDIKTYRPRIRIGTDPLAQARAVRAHLMDEAARYIPNATVRTTTTQPSLLLVNLVDKTSDQRRLGRALEAVLKAVLDVYSTQNDSSLPWLNASSIRHFWYDFHAEVKAGRWDKLVGLLDQVKPTLDGQGYFWAVPSRATGRANERLTFDVKQIQSGVVRTNCMDCLDRTNVAQSIFGRYMLFEQLAHCLHLPQDTQALFQQSPMTLPWHQGEVAHRLLWADNADLISRLYAGTPALKGDFTRTGKRTKQGALNDGVNSLQRYYLNNFLDADRQEGVSLLTGEEPFSHVGSDPTDEDSMTADSHDSSRTTMSVQEAARRMLLGAPLGDNDVYDSDRDHVRIKAKRARSVAGRAFVRSHPSLDLRWLPGDLQTQVRGVFSHGPAETGFQSQEYLDSLDLRSASDTPWWVVADSDSDSEVATGSPLDASLNNPGLVLGALVWGTRAPLTMAVAAVAIVATASLAGPTIN